MRMRRTKNHICYTYSPMDSLPAHDCTLLRPTSLDKDARRLCFKGNV